ncbi:hypothetical protein A2524_02540 [Candidatus Wolfebacteria bacterium RIFOXYD12_FULL_48_21]|uniref:Uncharacterized protein n=1 Tax=Candidatus Wolfebacteria bacterium RIFOXYD1_FULL_48_65 TaxID=1802561 RepID=A0A1F8DZ48_9BACT|nr:MAG: hypothetical protein A2610_01210 [Candidatus Wolfebacteria bacterium RIFOXYD1_FULL_48_65]OGM94746.1 MAG: hypothetical protein A2524_02540 [Candidatus Wolfebacteria bacterium RIFOXYD12_FULL_48_21]OGM95813.1 MAG: hypothetical protein A2532_00375 [Candidatus Wolfebacteria bacterium RIFOXYD2_FULL_48_11]
MRISACGTADSTGCTIGAIGSLGADGIAVDCCDIGGTIGVGSTGAAAGMGAGAGVATGGCTGADPSAAGVVFFSISKLSMVYFFIDY